LRFLITGAGGRLGTQLQQHLAQQDEHQVVGLSQADLDITNFQQVRERVAAHTPDAVIHCAAWTDVDGCARDPQRAIVVNGYGAGNVAAAAQAVGALIVHISSNEVFSGRDVSHPYLEYDSPQPLNPYGYSKYVGEQEVSRLNPRHIIIRTSWLFAHGGKNFLQSIIGAAQAGRALRVVVDEIAHPTYTNDFAESLTQLVVAKRPGVYHLVNQGAVSRWTFARYVLNRAGYEQTPIEKISRSEWKRASTPPPNTPLANLHAAQLGIQMRPWQQAVDDFLLREGLYADG